MPLALRIIPRLDIKGPNLVKGEHLEGLRVYSWRAPHLWEKINSEWLFKYPIK